MEFLLVLAALAALALPVAVIVLLVSVSGLKLRMEALERQVAELAAAPRAKAPRAETAAHGAERVASPPVGTPEPATPEVPQADTAPEVPQDAEKTLPRPAATAPRDPWGVPAGRASTATPARASTTR